MSTTSGCPSGESHRHGAWHSTSAGRIGRLRAPGRSLPYRYTWLFAASVLVQAVVVFGVASEPEDAAATAASSAPPAVYMGAKVCQQCHFDRWESYSNSPHGLAGDPRTPAAKHECETCHGAGGNHVGGGGGRGVGGVRPFNDTMKPAEINAVCLECHSRGIVKLWPGSVHETRDLACTNCHSIHSGYTKLLVQPSQPQVCTGCHRQIRAELMRPSHHPIREEKLVCTDCHNPHGTVTEKLISATSINNKCYECHAEKRGPFVFEHPPVRENCLNCHVPHGSVHEPLLRVKRPLLCQRCHNTLGHPSVPWTLSEDEAAAGRSVYEIRRQGLPATMLFQHSCTNCHVNIHGSNDPSGKFWHR